MQIKPSRSFLYFWVYFILLCFCFVLFDKRPMLSRSTSLSVLQCPVGVQSLRYKVVSIQVDSTQIEVVSRHHQSRFDTRRKSIRFNSTFMFSTVKWSDRHKNCNPDKPMKMLPSAHSYEKRAPNRFFGIRDMAYFKAGIRDFEGKGGRDSGL